MTAAEQLTGVELEGGWKVIERIQSPPGSTGGHFSCSYKVIGPEEKEAFLKALDFSKAFESDDPARALQTLTEAYNFERDVLEACRDKHMDRVVRVLADGRITVGAGGTNTVVQYLIFEAAEGDIRSRLQDHGAEIAWKLRCLQQIATGLKQLHRVGIAHQDVKPSNILTFAEKISKIADLGRAARKGYNPPHEDLDCAGDLSYAPPELLYGQVDTDWNRRRAGCDVYLLGSMVVFFFTGLSTTGILMNALDDEHHWKRWDGSYDEVLPYIRVAFNRLIGTFEGEIESQKLREELVPIVRQMCDPDPSLRGDPTNRERGSNPFALDRYVTRFDLLARRAAIGFFKK
jgi:eukaryotic-like serine/threonine-protein kinase